HNTLVLLKGETVALGPTAEVFAEPMHPYTRRLLVSVPAMRKGWLEEVMACDGTHTYGPLAPLRVCMSGGPVPIVGAITRNGDRTMPEQDTANMPAEPASEQERSDRLTRQDWLDLALRTLVEDGIDRVKIQIMARRLDVARSSFYWHFESSEALHKAMLEDWLKKNTSPIIERAMRPAPDIIRAVVNVFECWID